MCPYPTSYFRAKRFKSSAEIRSRTKTNRSSSQKQTITFSDNDQCSRVMPVHGTMNRARKCRFCGGSSHTTWQKCLKEGKASQINASYVEGTKQSMKDFIDNMNDGFYYMWSDPVQNNVCIHRDIPKTCKHVIIHSLSSTTGQNESAANAPIVNISLLGDKAIHYCRVYDNVHFDIAFWHVFFVTAVTFFFACQSARY